MLIETSESGARTQRALIAEVDPAVLVNELADEPELLLAQPRDLAVEAPHAGYRSPSDRTASPKARATRGSGSAAAIRSVVLSNTLLSPRVVSSRSPLKV